ncbi:MAG: selenocysteine-specific translation elongation factor [Chthoniobacterales bacterium]
MKNFILATAGHVDHGKTALIKALTGTDTDRLPEEKKRGITIELGFAHLALGEFSIGIVDVPGHEDFVRNMVGGVGSIDLALLVVAADDGWMPQTEEHLQILEYLGVRHAIVALTKIDLSEDVDVREVEIRAQLVNSPFANAPITHTSINRGHGIVELKAALTRAFASLAPAPDIRKPRLAVDRAFALRGIGTVVTGTLIGGTFRKGDAIVVQPAGNPGRIRTLQNHHREIEQIGPGTRAALNLSDVAIASERGDRGVWRGDVITLRTAGEAGEVADVLLTRSSRLPAQTRSLKQGAAVRVHHGTGHSSARLSLLSGDELRAGESAIARLRFEKPIFLFAGDRFVIRDSSGQTTVAGGIVLDPDAAARSFRHQRQRKFLHACASAPDSLGGFVRAQIERDQIVRRSELLLQSRWSAPQVAAELEQLCKSGRALTRDDLVFDAQSWSDVCQRAALLIDAEHAANPERVGLELVRLRGAFAESFRLADGFSALVNELRANGFARTGETIHRATHQPSAPASLQPAVARIRAALAAKPFDPPSRKELAPDGTSQQALRFLRDAKELVEIGPELVLGRETVAEMQRRVSEFIRARGSASVSDLRQAMGSSRRVMVPLLEYFDRVGVTRRVGDKRALAR